MSRSPAKIAAEQRYERARPERRRQVISVRVSLEERERLAAEAAEAGLTLGAYIKAKLGLPARANTGRDGE